MSPKEAEFAKYMIEKAPKLAWRAEDGTEARRDFFGAPIKQFWVIVSPSDQLRLLEKKSTAYALVTTIEVPGLYEQARRIALNVDEQVDACLRLLGRK